MSAAFAIAYRLTAGDWSSSNQAFTTRTLPSTRPPGCGTRFGVMSRHALVPFPFRGLSRFIIGTGKSGGQKLCQQASFSRTLLLLSATAAHALQVTIPSVIRSFPSSRPQPPPQYDGGKRSDGLGKDKARCSRRGDARKRIGDRPRNGHCRVGEGCRGREPVCRGNMEPHRVCAGRQPARSMLDELLFIRWKSGDTSTHEECLAQLDE